MDVAPRSWTRETHDLWHRLTAHSFEDPTVALDFARRLARTLGWSIEASRAGLEEYRRFCFLAVVNDGAPVTPSEEVDEIWHLHLTYTRDYWERWCGVALGRPLHHDPTAGGPVERRRYRAQYAETLALYEAYFGPPPAAFWPGTAKRFAARPRFRLIDGDTAFAIPRPAPRRFGLAGLAALFVLVTTQASAQGWNPLDLPGGAFLQLFCLLLATAVVASLVLRTVVRATGRSADLTGLSPLATAYASGGAARAADTLFLTLAAAGAASHDGRTIAIGRLPGQPHADIAPFHAAIQGARSRRALISDFKRSPATRALRDDLERRNILLTFGRGAWLAVATAAPVAFVLGLGVAKIAVGTSRGRPVGYLVTLCMIGAILLVRTLLRERYLTRGGREALTALRARHNRAIRAPRAEELPFAFALGGAAVLAGTAYAAYAQSIESGGDGGGGCGGGGGGGEEAGDVGGAARENRDERRIPISFTKSPVFENGHSALSERHTVCRKTERLRRRMTAASR